MTSLRHSRSTAVVLVTATAVVDFLAFSMAVPVLPDLSRRLGASPTTIGLLFGIFGVSVLATSVPMGGMSDRIGVVMGGAAVMSALLHPGMGRLADRMNLRGLMLAGLGGIGLMLPLLSLADTFVRAAVVYAAFMVPVAAMVTPSLADMAAATTASGVRSFGVAYGIYNCAWATGLLLGPTLGGAAYERMGFTRLLVVAAVVLLVATLFLSRVPVARAEQGEV